MFFHCHQVVLSGYFVHFFRWIRLDVLSGRHFVRNLQLVKGGYEWFGVGYRVVKDGFRWFLVVTSGYKWF